MTKVRTRFAPSPTGFLHVGGVRTALFAWLVARQNNGTFILRLEDTDKSRHVEGAEAHIIDSLKALGLEPDEGPHIGGDYGPYRQSERLDIYKEYAQKLIDKGLAYVDPYSPQELDGFRAAAKQAKKPFKFRDHRPQPEDWPVWDGTKPLRFKSEAKTYQYVDMVYGPTETSPEATDDFILIKSDGYPTYNFAHIVDDHEMQVSHIIRGQEFLASMPNYLNLYEALGIADSRPQIATVPHILNETGNKKLSKRDGAKDVLDYIKDGFLPDALVSFIATLGWNDGTTQEIFSRQELIDKFDLGRVQRGGAHFDEKRLLWINGHFIRELPLEQLAQLCENYWPESAAEASSDYKLAVLGLVQERLKYLGELAQLTNFFFEDLPVNSKLISDHKQLSKIDSSTLKELLKTSRSKLETCDFSQQHLTDCLNELLTETYQKPVILFSLIRIATTQAAYSPGLAESLAVLGKETVLRRIDQQIDSL